MNILQRARQVNLIDYCEYKGLEFIRDGNENYRVVGYSGLIIKYNYFNHTSANIDEFPGWDYFVNEENTNLKGINVNEFISFGSGKFSRESYEQMKPLIKEKYNEMLTSHEKIERANILITNSNVE